MGRLGQVITLSWPYYIRKWAAYSMYSMLGNEVNLWIRLFLLWVGQVRSFLYPGHIGLGNGPHMYSMLGNELNLWIRFFLLWGGQARSFLYPGHIGLGNGPHTVCQVMNSIYGLGYSYYGEVRLGHSFILAILYQVMGRIQYVQYVR